MLNLKFFTFSTIRSKITLFVLFMMLVTIALVAVYMHSSGTMRKLRNVDTMSQRAAREILQATIIQEKFINTGNGDLLISYESIRKDLRTAMADLQSSAVNGDLSKKVESMLAMVSHCDEIFGSMAQSLSRMHSHRKKISSKIDPVETGVTSDWKIDQALKIGIAQK